MGFTSLPLPKPSEGGQMDPLRVKWFLREHKAGRLDVTPNLRLAEFIVIGDPAGWYLKLRKDIAKWVKTGHNEYCSISRINYSLNLIYQYHAQIAQKAS